MRLLLLVCAPLASVLYAQSNDPVSPGLRERWDEYVNRTYDWKRVGVVALESSVEQSFQFNKCGRPPYCFPHHIGGSLTRRTARSTIELAAGALLSEDIKRRPSGLPEFRQRIAFVLTHALLAKDSKGNWRPAYSRYAGTMGAVTLSSAWHGRPLTTGHLASSFGWSVTSYFQDAFLTEFDEDFRRIGKHMWQRLRRQ